MFPSCPIFKLLSLQMFQFPKTPSYSALPAAKGDHLQLVGCVFLGIHTALVVQDLQGLADTKLIGLRFGHQLPRRSLWDVEEWHLENLGPFWSLIHVLGQKRDLLKKLLGMGKITVRGHGLSEGVSCSNFIQIHDFLCFLSANSNHIPIH